MADSKREIEPGGQYFDRGVVAKPTGVIPCREMRIDGRFVPEVGLLFSGPDGTDCIPVILTIEDAVALLGMLSGTLHKMAGRSDTSEGQ